MCSICRLRSPGTDIVSTSRRSMLGALGSVVVAGAAGLFPQASSAQAYKPANVLTPDEAQKRLMQGNERYVANQSSSPRDFASTRGALAAGQNPYACILGCADSRVSPELCFDEATGDLFVTRVAGNYVTNDILASLEYGVAVLKAQFIMVLGHTSCGAISAAVSAFQKNTAFPGHIQSIATALKPAVLAASKGAKGDALVAATTIENVKQNVKRLQESTPILRDMIRSGKLKVAGGLYHLDTGRVEPIV